MISTGNSTLDSSIGGYKLGDNVVWQVADGVPVDYFIRDFFTEGHNREHPVIYINFNFSPQTILKRYEYLFTDQKTILVDAFTNGKGNSDSVFSDFYSDHSDDRFICIEDPRDVRSFIETLNCIENDNKHGSFYIFDSLTGMNELWKDEKRVLDFFSFTCPKLYDLNTLAYWILAEDAHSREFFAGIVHITQIVFALQSSNSDYFEFRIKKLEDRPAYYDGEQKYFKISDDGIQFLKKRPESPLNPGKSIKKLRREMKLTQSELSSLLNITPGAVSQIENDLVTPSLQTLVHLSRIFNKPVDDIIDPSRTGSKSYILTRMGIPITSPHRNIAIKRLIESADEPFEPFSVAMPPEKTLDDPILLHKGTEFITVTQGSMRLTIGNEDIKLSVGDSILLRKSFIEKITTEKEGCEFLYILL